MRCRYPCIHLHPYPPGYKSMDILMDGSGLYPDSSMAVLISRAYLIRFCFVLRKRKRFLFPHRFGQFNHNGTSLCHPASPRTLPTPLHDAKLSKTAGWQNSRRDDTDITHRPKPKPHPPLPVASPPKRRSGPKARSRIRPSTPSFSTRPPTTVS